MSYQPKRKQILEMAKASKDEKATELNSILDSGQDNTIDFVIKTDEIVHKIALLNNEVDINIDKERDYRLLYNFLDYLNDNSIKSMDNDAGTIYYLSENQYDNLKKNTPINKNDENIVDRYIYNGKITEFKYIFFNNIAEYGLINNTQYDIGIGTIKNVNSDNLSISNVKYSLIKNIIDGKLKSMQKDEVIKKLIKNTDIQVSEITP